MDRHHPSCVDGFGCGCTDAPHVEFQLLPPPAPPSRPARWLAAIGQAAVWLLKWP
jgi:hypothetical protein